ncbi:MAG TPA: tyrosine--tRNA ligase [Candidatus Acidoferrales bacterium]|nr:tyrosine--tRNA ligase [Candidatus Acidoferrales bacterium]
MPEARRQSVDDQLAYLRKGAVEIIPEAEFRAKLENSAKTGKPLRVYLGVDPTAPDLHLGHTVVIRKLKHFQDLGHTAIFLIGDFSAMIGDPTGQSETRPPLSREQVDANAKTYLSQVFKILDPQKTEVRYNSEWLGKLSSYEMVKLCGKYRLARMLEREDFSSRLDKNLPIAIHELLYPLLTALDAVHLQSDVELGATEQKFNLLVHREIQREYGLPGQAILTMPILVGLDGAKKMSKSLGNYVGITESPNEMFGKLMSISDDLMWSYYELVTDFDERTIVRLKEEVRTGVLHPMDAKMQLAHNVIAGFHGEAAARSAADEFQRVFRNRQAPTEMEEIRLKLEGNVINVQRGIGPNARAGTITGTLTTIQKWSSLLHSLTLARSVADAERLIKQGGFEVDGKSISDPTSRLNFTQPAAYLVRVGKKNFLRLIVE